MQVSFVELRSFMWLKIKIEDDFFQPAGQLTQLTAKTFKQGHSDDDFFIDNLAFFSPSAGGYSLC